MVLTNLKHTCMLVNNLEDILDKSWEKALAGTLKAHTADVLYPLGPPVKLPAAAQKQLKASDGAGLKVLNRCEDKLFKWGPPAKHLLPLPGAL